MAASENPLKGLNSLMSNGRKRVTTAEVAATKTDAAEAVAEVANLTMKRRRKSRR